MNQIEGGVTAAKGFQATGVAAQIKYKDRYDMAIVFSEQPCAAAGAFTTNRVKAAPVLWDKHIVEEGESLHAVIINSGIANACTGKKGYDYCRTIAKTAAEELNITQDSVAVASTGVIGMQLPIHCIVHGIGLLKDSMGPSIKDGHDAACAIMTTDTKPKEIAFEFEVSDVKCKIGGMCKGSGMIHPNMCTMLCFITTDVKISKALLTKALKSIVKDTFNMISVDGDTSTNDTVIVMANGEAGNPDITEEGADYESFYKALYSVMENLSKKIAGDGEGCTCLFECQVKNADSKENARILAKSVISSSLTKAAIFGHDANWGRILCALGYAGVDFDPEKVDISLESEAGSLKIVGNGVSAGYDESIATEILSQEYVRVICDIKNGKESATAWGCDLTYEYVRINGDYRS